MKKLILAAIAVTCAASVFAQGTITFNNHITGTESSRVYAPLASNVYFSQLGNGTADTPTGSTVWSAFNAIGVSGIAVQYGAAFTIAQIIGAPGSGVSEGSLVPANPTTSFRTGAGIGWTSATTSTLQNVGLDSPATVEMVAWDNTSGQYANWTAAYGAWTKGLIAAGESGRWNATLGGTGTSPSLLGAQSFNLYFINVPEPGTFALAGLGLATMLVFRRRK